MSARNATASAGALSSAKELAGGVLKNADAVGKLMDGVRAVADAVREVAVQKTEQARIEGETARELARIQATKEVLLHYLDRTFDERRTNFDALFQRLDVAMNSGNVELVSATLNAVVTLASSSPFKDLTGSLRDKNTEFVF